MGIMNMSAQEIVLFPKLIELAQEAFKAEKIINKRFSSAFGIGKKEILVYHTQSFSEYYGVGYLTIDGIFKYHDNLWGGRDYEFSCDAEGIYRMFLSCYLKRYKLNEFETNSFECSIDDIDEYFRDFIKELENDEN